MATPFTVSEFVDTMSKLKEKENKENKKKDHKEEPLGTQSPPRVGGCEYFSVFVIGETGNGKSQFCLYLSGDPSAFHPSQSADSFTQSVFHKNVVKNNFSFTVYDTPGLNDKGKDADAHHIKEMVLALRGVQDCKAFLIVMNPHQPRFSKSTKETIEYFRDIFGVHMVANLALVWTRSDRGLAEKWRKLKDGKIKEKEFVGRVAELFGDVQGNIPSFYINSNPADDTYDYDEDFQNLEISKLLSWANSNKSFNCQQAKVVETKESKLEKEKKEIELKAKKEKEEIKAKAKKEKEEIVRKAKEEREEMEAKAKKEKEEFEREKAAMEAKAKRDRDEFERKRYDSRRNDSSETLLQLAMLMGGLGGGQGGIQKSPFSGGSGFQRPLSAPSGNQFDLPHSPERESYSDKPCTPIKAKVVRYKFYRGGQFIPGGGRAPPGGINIPIEDD